MRPASQAPLVPIILYSSPKNYIISDISYNYHAIIFKKLIAISDHSAIIVQKRVK